MGNFNQYEVRWIAKWPGRVVRLWQREVFAFASPAHALEAVARVASQHGM